MKRKILSFLIGLCLIVPVFFGLTACGPNSEDDSIYISSKEELVAFAVAVNSGAYEDEVEQGGGGLVVKLTEDIDMSGYEWLNPIGTSEHKFMGTFDGQGHQITNLSNNGLTTGETSENVTSGTTGHIFGLFGYTKGTTIIKNLTVSVNATGSDGLMFAGLVASSGYSKDNPENCNLTIDGVVVEGTITGSDKVAGFLGEAPYSTSSGTTIIKNSINRANVTASGKRAAGFIAGAGTNAEHQVNLISLQNCRNEGNITSGDWAAAFIASVNQSTSILSTLEVVKTPTFQMYNCVNATNATIAGGSVSNAFTYDEGSYYNDFYSANASLQRIGAALALRYHNNLGLNMGHDTALLATSVSIANDIHFGEAVEAGLIEDSISYKFYYSSAFTGPAVDTTTYGCYVEIEGGVVAFENVKQAVAAGLLLSESYKIVLTKHCLEDVVGFIRDARYDSGEKVFYTSWRDTDLKYTLDLNGFNYTNDDIEYVVNEEKVFSAWRDTPHTITFNTDGGSAVESIRKAQGDQVTAPIAPTKTGYDFVGWFNGMSEFTFPTTMPTTDVELVAHWTPHAYTLTFVFDNGEENAVSQVNFEAAVAAPEDPEKEGYTFAGWDNVVPATMPASNLTFTATWTPNNYTIFFNTNGGSNVDNITQAYGSSVAAPTEPTREGYDFTGWFVNQNTQQTFPFNMPLGGTTLVAHWTSHLYSITFENLGGATNDNPTSYTIIMPDIVLANPGERTGFTFVGWKEGLDDITTIAHGSTGNKTITAVWSANSYTLTFVFDNGEENEASQVSYGSEIIVPEDPEKEGYTFTGWDNEIPATMPANALTFTATWTINSYTLRFVIGHGEDDIVSQVEYGAAVAIPSNPEVAGYEFTAWDIAIPETMPAHNVTINAIMYAIQYPIIYELNGGTNGANPAAYTVEDETITLLNPTWTGEGFTATFQGWYDNAAFTGNAITTIPHGSTGNKTLYAKWHVVVTTEAALNAAIAHNYADVELGADIPLEAALTISHNATLDFGEYNLVGADINGAAIEVNEGVTFNVYATTGGVRGGSGADCKAIRAYGVLNIYGGTYSVGPDADGYGNGCVEAWGTATINIYDGTFSSDAEYNNIYFVLNQKNDATDSHINVYGGTFVNYDPSTGDDALGGNFVVETSRMNAYVMEDGDDIITIYMVFPEGMWAEVETAQELAAAVADTDVLYIILKDDIEFDTTLELDRRLMISGAKNASENYKLICEINKNAAIYITSEVVFLNVDVIGSVTQENGTLTSFGIRLGAEATFEMIGCNVSGYRYAIDSRGEDAEFIAINTTITAWAVMYAHSNNGMFAFMNCELVGVNKFDNPEDNNFGTIVFFPGTANNLVSLQNCDITVKGEGTAYQGLVYFQGYEAAKSQANHVSIKDCNITYEGNTYTHRNNGLFVEFTGDPTNSDQISAWINANNIVWVEGESTSNIVDQMRLNVKGVRGLDTLYGYLNEILDFTDGSWYAQDGDELHLLSSVELTEDVTPYLTNGTITLILGNDQLFGTPNTISGTGKIVLGTNLTIVSDTAGLTCFKAPAGYAVAQIDNGNGTYTYSSVAISVWDGTASAVPAENNNTITITTAQEFAAFRNSVNAGNTYEGKIIVLATDIDLNNIEWIPIGYGDIDHNGMTNQLGPNFKGTFNGQNHTVYNLKITEFTQGGVASGASAGVALFGQLLGSVENLNVDGAVVNGNHFVGVIAGYALSATITNCNVVNATISCTYASADNENGDKAGVILGYGGALNDTVANATTVTNCSATNCAIDAYRDAGQIIGCLHCGVQSGNTATNVTVTANHSFNDENDGTNINNDIVGRVKN